MAEALPLFFGYTVALTPTAFRASLRERESLANAGCVVAKDPATGWKVWRIAERIVGLSENSQTDRHLAVLALTEAQRELVEHLLDKGIRPEDLPEQLWREGSVTGFESKVLALRPGLQPVDIQPMGFEPAPGAKRLPLGLSVVLTPRYLESCTQVRRRQLEGRVGVIASYRLGAQLPFVRFPPEGRRSEVSIPEVDYRDLRVVLP